MSIEALNWAIEVRGVKGVEKLILLLLANRHNRDTGDCYPAMSRLVDESGLDRKTVIRALGGLESKGFLRAEKSAGKVNQYRLNTSTTFGTSPIYGTSTIYTPKQSHISQKVVPYMGHEPLSNPNKPLIKKSKFSDAHYEAAKTMADALQLRRPPNLEKWADVFRLMEERDGIGTDEAIEMFEWAYRDDFWCQNILSPQKLRQKWNQLAAKAASTKGNKTSRKADFIDDLTDTSWAH